MLATSTPGATVTTARPLAGMVFTLLTPSSAPSAPWTVLAQEAQSIDGTRRRTSRPGAVSGSSVISRRLPIPTIKSTAIVAGVVGRYYYYIPH